MTKEEILIDLINKILVDKYELHEVRRSNSNGSQEYHFVIKRPSMKENQRVGMKMNDEEIGMKLTEREKAYHDGYKQGRFDEYAERMGYDQAEKVKAKIDKQKNCPYCHEEGGDHRLKMIEDDPDGQAGLVLRDDGWHLWTADPFIFEVLFPISYCPMCGRPLNEEE